MILRRRHFISMPLVYHVLCSWFCCQIRFGISKDIGYEQRRRLYFRMLQNNTSGTRKTSWNKKSQQPTSSPIQFEHVYEAGNLDHTVMGITLSKGLTASLVAAVGFPVWYENGTMSKEEFMEMPDAAATFPTTDGGWIYTINSEYRLPKPLKRTSAADNLGGVSGIRFNKHGETIGYKILLNGTYANCGGGRTPWGVSNNLVGI
jgi:hypothetical protein